MKQNETTQSFDVIIIGGDNHRRWRYRRRNCQRLLSQGHKNTSIGKIRHLYRCHGEKSRLIA